MTEGQHHCLDAPQDSRLLMMLLKVMSRQGGLCQRLTGYPLQSLGLHVGPGLGGEEARDSFLCPPTDLS